MASFDTLLQTAKAAILAESTLSFFNNRVACAQAGYFLADKVRQPNLVISPVAERQRAAGSRLLNARDDVVTVTYYIYQDGFGTEAGLFGDSNITGLLDMTIALKTFLAANQLSGVTIPEWVSTEYPNYFDRNFEKLSEARLTFTYGLRGAV